MVYAMTCGQNVYGGHGNNLAVTKHRESSQAWRHEGPSLSLSLSVNDVTVNSKTHTRARFVGRYLRNIVFFLACSCP